MSDWKQQYLAALEARDNVEKANLALYNYCTKLADQKAELEKKKTVPEQSDDQEQPASPPPSIVTRGLYRVASPQTRPESPSVTQIRQDLGKAQQERAELQTRLETATRELDLSKSKSKADARSLAQLTARVSQLTVKLRDREEELRGKAKLIENVQDENVTLNLQLNMAEEQSDKLRKENQELVDRWMARMGEEADKMNLQHKFG